MGQDAYQSAKRNFGFILLLVIVGSALYGSYKVGVWWGRNYRSVIGGVCARLGALILLGMCWVGTLLVGTLWLGSGFLPPGPRPADMTLAEGVAGFLNSDSIAGTVTLILLGLVGLGVLRGLASRPGRRRRWAADVHNAAFFTDHGLQEVQEDRLRDSDDTGYRLANVLPGELEFEALGHTGLYAYLTFDETGRYTAWSGLVPQR